MSTKIKGINLLPNEYIVAQRINFYQKMIGLAVAVEVICFIFLFALPPKKEVVQTQDELITLQSQLSSPRYEGVNKTLNDLETAKADIQNWMSQYKSIKVEGSIGGKLLDELTARIPSGLNVRIISLNDALDSDTGTVKKSITISGRADTPDQILDYLSTMETLFMPKNIAHTYSFDEKTQKYNFDFNITDSAEGVEVKEGAEDVASENAQPSDTTQPDENTEGAIGEGGN